MGRPHLKNPNEGLTTVIAATEESGKMGKWESVKRLLQGPWDHYVQVTQLQLPMGSLEAQKGQHTAYSVVEPLSHPVGGIGPFW